MGDILDWHQVARPEQAIRFLTNLLCSGHLLALPTESGHIVVGSAIKDEVVKRLQDIDSHSELEILSPSSSNAQDWMPAIGDIGKRILQKFWPGPLILISREKLDEGLFQRLGAKSQNALCRDQFLRLRSPSQEITKAVLRRARVPLVCLGRVESHSQETGEESFKGNIQSKIDLTVEYRNQYFQPPTVVEIREGKWFLHHQGIIEESDIQSQLACVIVFVCTGNTCRSPMAEALCKKRLAERLGCLPEDLSDRGYLVFSAGLSAGSGYPAAGEAVEVVRRMGADLSGHQSRLLTYDLVSRADHLLVMTERHARALEEQLPPGSCKPRLICPQGEDVTDPIGGPLEVYEACARQLDSYVGYFLSQLSIS